MFHTKDVKLHEGLFYCLDLTEDRAAIPTVEIIAPLYIDEAKDAIAEGTLYTLQKMILWRHIQSYNLILYNCLDVLKNRG